MPERQADRERNEADQLEVTVLRGGEAGNVFRGWESISVSRNLNAPAGTFELTVSDRIPWPIKPSDRVEIRLGGELVMTGQVDALQAESGAGQHRVQISGRDMTAVLIDSSALNDPGEWFGMPLERLAEEIANPFGIEIVDELGEVDRPLVFEHFKLQPSESAWNAIERACRVRGVLAHADEKGRLVLVRAGAAGAADTDLLEGTTDSPVTGLRPGNLIRTVIRYTHAERFNLYVVRGQAGGSDDGWAEDIALMEGRAFDPEIPEARQLLVLAEGAVTFQDAQDRAQWEATQRASKGSTVTSTLAGWKQTSSRFANLWRVNLRLAIKVPSLQLDSELLVEQVRFSRSLREGTLTVLRLVRADAFQPKPIVEEKEQPFDALLGGEEVDF